MCLELMYVEKEDIIKYYADRLIISMENILTGIKDYNKLR